MEYIPFESIPYFAECSAVVSSAGFHLVELHVVPQSRTVRVTAVIASKDPEKDISLSDCSKAHRALAPKIIALLKINEDDVSMELCSPGTERNFKNAAEFAVFAGRGVRVWSKAAGGWISGTVKSADKSQVVLETEDSSEKAVAYSDIAKAKFIHS